MRAHTVDLPSNILMPIFYLPGARKRKVPLYLQSIAFDTTPRRFNSIVAVAEAQFENLHTGYYTTRKNSKNFLKNTAPTINCSKL